MSQDLTGLDVSREYTVTYDWSLADRQQIYDGRCSVTVSLGGQTFDKSTIGRGGVYQYQSYNVVVTPPSADATLLLSFACSGSYFYGADLVLDDITMTTSCTPCTAVSPPPEGLVCGQEGRGSLEYAFELDGGDASSLENCADSCVEDDACETFSYYRGSNQGSCALYSGSPAEINFVQIDGYSDNYYQPGCFQCGSTATGRSTTTSSSIPTPTFI